jgi:hypothetical protein
MTPRFPGPSLALAIIVALSAPAVCSADFKSSYRQGLSAADQGDWSAVVAAMEEATAEEPNASKSKIKHYGTRFVPYTPYYYLGLAHYNLGNCEGAVRAWETSTSQGIAKLGDVQAQLEECRAKLVKPTSQPTATPIPVATRPPLPPKPDRQLIERETGTAEGAIKGAAAAERSVTEMRANPDTAQAWNSDASLQKAFGDAAKTLASARTTLQRGISEEDPDTIRQAADLANQAQRDFERLQPRLREVQDRLVQARTAREQERIADQTRLDEEAGRAAEARAAEARRTQTARATRVLPATPAPSQSRPEAPTSLRSAAAAFLSGDYPRTILLLADESFGNSSASALAHLLNAASRFGLYHEGGESDDNLRTMAEDDIRLCKRLDSSITPDENAFSPRFVRFFVDIR